MAIKLKLSAVEYAALTPELQKEYMADGPNYRVMIDGDGDPAALARAVEHEKTQRKAAEQKARELQEAADENARKAKDIPALESSWKKQLDDAKAETAAFKKEAADKLAKILVANVANQLANKLAINADVAELLVPTIAKRLAVAEKNGEPVTVILDGEGKESTLTLGDLEKEVRDNGKFSAIITGSKGSGSGAAGSPGASGGGKPFKEMNEAERTELYRKDPERFNKLAAENAA